MKTHKCKTSSYKVSHGVVMYSIGKIVYIVVTLYGDRWLLDKLWYPIIRWINTNSLCKIPEINIMLHVNYTIIKTIINIKGENLYESGIVISSRGFTLAFDYISHHLSLK